MKLTIAALTILMWPSAGAYPVTFPVEGLTDANAAQLKSLLQEKLGKNRDGEEILYKVGDIKDGHATIVLGCQSGTSIVNVRAALEGSPFSLKMDTWLLYGKFTLYWKSGAAMTDEARRGIEEKLTSWGTAELRTWQKKDTGHHYLARVKLVGKTESLAWKDVTAFLAGHGVTDPELCWDNVPIREEWVRVDCGARRAKESTTAK